MRPITRSFNLTILLMWRLQQGKRTDISYDVVVLKWNDIWGFWCYKSDIHHNPINSLWAWWLKPGLLQFDHNHVWFMVINSGKCCTWEKLCPHQAEACSQQTRTENSMIHFFFPSSVITRKESGWLKAIRDGFIIYSSSRNYWAGKS